MALNCANPNAWMRWCGIEESSHERGKGVRSVD